MKRPVTSILGWGLGILLVATGALQAHGPRKIELSYDRAESLLTVTVQHPVGDPRDHFIKRIRVWVDDEAVADRTYERQVENISQTDTFTLPEVKAGTEIRVKATCNKIGAKAATLTVPGNPGEET